MLFYKNSEDRNLGGKKNQFKNIRGAVPSRQSKGKKNVDIHNGEASNLERSCIGEAE